MKMIKNKFLLSTENGSNENFEMVWAIGAICDRISIALFKKYRQILLDESITYIVWAIWGTKKDGKLDKTQIEINRQIVPELDKVMEYMKGDSLSFDQRISVSYLVRGYIISKITYMIELYRAKSFESAVIGQRGYVLLDTLQTIGTA